MNEFIKSTTTRELLDTFIFLKKNIERIRNNTGDVEILKCLVESLAEIETELDKRGMT